MKCFALLLWASIIWVFVSPVDRAAADTAPAASPGQLTVGGIYGLTGMLAGFGDEFSKGSRLYVLSEPAGERRVSLVVEDSKWEPKAAVAAFQKLVEFDGVRAVHVMGSGPSLAIKPLSEARRVILFSAGAHPELIPGSTLVIRHGNLASEDAKSFAMFVARKVPEHPSVASLYLENEWGESFERTFESSLKEQVPNVSLSAESHRPEEQDYKSLLVRLLKGAPSALVVNSTGIPVAVIIEQARALGYAGPVFANNGLALSREAQVRLRALHDENIFFQSYPNVPPEFRELYVKEYGTEPSYFSVTAFTDLELLDSAVRHVGDDTGKIVAYIKALGSFEGRFATLHITADGDIVIPTEVQQFR